MTLHLVKLCVGVDQVDQLKAWQQQRLEDLVARGETPELVHVTRMTPRRRDEILDGGSLYWVIKRYIVVRQRILDLRPITGKDGINRCGIVYGPELVATKPVPRRPFQGWRYLTAEDAPKDAVGGGRAGDLPESLKAELGELGLL